MRLWNTNKKHNLHFLDTHHKTQEPVFRTKHVYYTKYHKNTRTHLNYVDFSPKYTQGSYHYKISKRYLVIQNIMNLFFKNTTIKTRTLPLHYNTTTTRATQVEYYA